MYILMVCASSSAIDGLLPNLLANIKRRDARYPTNLTTVGSDWVTDVTCKFFSWVATKRQQIMVDENVIANFTVFSWEQK